MRTKSFLTAGTLAMLMVACSNEEFQVMDNQLDSNRPLAENVVLTPAMGGDAESRAQFDMNTGKWAFSDEGDKFAAMLMDNWDMQGEGIEHYNFVDHIHTNYPFVSEDGGYTWKSVAGAPLCEGNYFFTYPYDSALTSRGNVYFKLETEQTNEEDGNVNPLVAVKNYQRYMGYAFVEGGKGVNEVAPMFHGLFANPKFSITNGTGGAIRVIKLIIRTHQEGSAATPALMPTTIQLAPETAGFAQVNRAYAAGDLIDENESAYAKRYKEEIAALFSHATKVQDGFFGIDQTKGTYEYVINCGDNYVVNHGDPIRLSAIMPAGEYHNFDVYAFIELQNAAKTTGVVSLTDVAEPHWTNMDVQSGSMQTVLKPGITQVYTASFDWNAVKNLGMESFAVVSSKDMQFILELKAKNGGRDMVTIKTLGEDVVMTKEIYDLIAAEERAGIKVAVDGYITIPKDAAANAMDLLATDANPNAKTIIVNEGTQVLTKSVYNCDVVNKGKITETVSVKVTVNGNVTNAAGAEMTVTTVNGNVDNKGIIAIETVNGNVHNGKYMAEKDEDGIAPVTAATATVGRLNKDNTSARNWGTFNLNSSDDNTGISNKYCGVMNLMGGYVYFITNRGGEVNVVEDSKVYGLTNDGGLVNVNDNLTITNTLTNTNVEHYTLATINVAQDAALKGIDGIINNGENAVVNVTGKLSDNVYNAGLINVIEDGIVVVYGIYNGIIGTIDVTKANATTKAQAAKCVNSTSMYFAYTVGEEETATELVVALKARISDVNYGKNPVKLTWGATSATKFAGMLDSANAENVTINNDLTLAGNTRFQDVKTDKFVVNGFLTIANGYSLEVPEEICVVVNGTLKANNWAKLIGSNVTVCGEGEVITASGVTVGWSKKDGSNITWTGNN